MYTCDLCTREVHDRDNLTAVIYKDPAENFFGYDTCDLLICEKCLFRQSNRDYLLEVEDYGKDVLEPDLESELLAHIAWFHQHQLAQLWPSRELICVDVPELPNGDYLDGTWSKLLSTRINNFNAIYTQMHWQWTGETWALAMVEVE